MLRVLVVASTSYAGMGPYVSEIINSFSSSDNVYYLLNDSHNSFFEKNIKHELLPHCIFYKEETSIYKRIKELLIQSISGFNKKVVELCNQMNIDAVHFINGSMNNCLLKKLKQNGIIILNTVHDLHSHEIDKAFHKELRWKILMNRVYKDMEFCQNLTTNSLMQYEELQMMFPKKNISFHEFPSLVSTEIALGQDVVAELDNCSKPYILFFGRIEAYKGLDVLYKAYINSKILKNKYALVIAGKGDLNFTIDVDNDIFLINRYIKDSEVAYLYNNASAIVYPYISATQSGVLSLAFYFQRPVLTSDVPYFKSTIEASSTGLVFKNGDSSDLADKLLQLLSSDNAEMICNQNKYYCQNYQKGAIREQLLNIYNHLK